MVCVNLVDEIEVQRCYQGIRQENGNFEISEKSLKGRSVSHGTEYVAAFHIGIATAVMPSLFLLRDRFVPGGLQKDNGVVRVENRRLLGTYYFYYRSRGTPLSF
jgi:hypothetical protein